MSRERRMWTQKGSGVCTDGQRDDKRRQEDRKKTDLQRLKDKNDERTKSRRTLSEFVSAGGFFPDCKLLPALQTPKIQWLVPYSYFIFFPSLRPSLSRSSSSLTLSCCLIIYADSSSFPPFLKKNSFFWISERPYVEFYLMMFVFKGLYIFFFFLIYMGEAFLFVFGVRIFFF